MAYAKIVHEWDDSEAVTAMEVGGDLENLDTCVEQIRHLWRELVGEELDHEPETGA